LAELHIIRDVFNWEIYLTGTSLG